MHEIIQKIIHKKSNDNLMNHVKTVLFIREGFFIGFINGDDFKIWKYSYWWSGAFYPVIKGKIVKHKGKQKIQYRTTLNSFGQLVQFIILAGMTYAMIEMEIFSLYLLKSDWIFPLLGVAFIGLFMVPIRVAYLTSKKDVIEEFKEIINKKTFANSGS
jgi:hypothetical protein